jgi:hypothetical protein
MTVHRPRVIRYCSSNSSSSPAFRLCTVQQLPDQPHDICLRCDKGCKNKLLSLYEVRSTALTAMGIQQRASGLIARIQSLVDKVVSPDARKEYYSKTVAFAQDQPILFVCFSSGIQFPPQYNLRPDVNSSQTFILIQFLLSSTPIALFLAFALGTLALSFITALLFSIFWIGIALLLLVPTLFITVSLGIVLWVWAVSSFLIARWVYNFVPVRVAQVTKGKMPNYFAEFSTVKISWVNRPG